MRNYFNNTNARHPKRKRKPRLTDEAAGDGKTHFVIGEAHEGVFFCFRMGLFGANGINTAPFVPVIR